MTERETGNLGRKLTGSIPQKFLLEISVRELPFLRAAG